MSEIIFSKEFPVAPARLFLVGIGGIGMSGLAQFLRHQGYEVAGSDRGIAEPARKELFDALSRQGIRLFPQDGSGPREFHPDGFVFTTAIEPGNPDQMAAPETPVFHRAFVLAQLCRQCGGSLIGVAGTCGKTSVTGWIGSALNALGRTVLLIDGGYLPEFESESMPGNFYVTKGVAKPEFVVAEIDESDHSISEFSPDYGLVLNVGDDHYGTEELERVFKAFLSRCEKGGVYPENCAAVVPSPANTLVGYDCSATGYRSLPTGMRFTCGGVEISCTQSGVHSAWNAAAVFAVLRMALPNEPKESIAAALGAFRGVRQRFEVLTCPSARVAVINDYAHNPEKIAAAICAAKERFGAPVGVAFQPHGFGALRFMRDALREHLAKVLDRTDAFLMLPVYYAGGTVDFSPTSQEVADDFSSNGIPVQAVETRAEAEKILAAGNFKAWLIVGARDASLRTWSRDLAERNS